MKHFGKAHIRTKINKVEDTLLPERIRSSTSTARLRKNIEDITWVFTVRFMRMYGLDLTGKGVERDCRLLFQDKITTFEDLDGNHTNDVVSLMFIGPCIIVIVEE